MRRFAPVVAALAVAACKSSAPYTVPAAAINAGVALGVSAAQKSGGGCYAVCTNGTVCNAKTGLCESSRSADFCEEAPGGGTRCVPVDLGLTRQGSSATGTSGLGVAPSTGAPPPPPAEASPKAP
jgi:hypothetical protein